MIEQPPLQLEAITRWLPLVTTVIVVGATVALQTWLYRANLSAARIREFTDRVREAADLGVEYWLLEAKDDPEKNAALEARLLGYQIMLDGILEEDITHISHMDVAIVRHAMTQLHRALTGGEFMGRNRQKSPEMARRVQSTAAQLIVAVTRGRLVKARLRRTIR